MLSAAAIAQSLCNVEKARTFATDDLVSGSSRYSTTTGSYTTAADMQVAKLFLP